MYDINVHFQFILITVLRASCSVRIQSEVQGLASGALWKWVQRLTEVETHLLKAACRLQLYLTSCIRSTIFAILTCIRSTLPPILDSKKNRLQYHPCRSEGGRCMIHAQLHVHTRLIKQERKKGSSRILVFKYSGAEEHRKRTCGNGIPKCSLIPLSHRCAGRVGTGRHD